MRNESRPGHIAHLSQDQQAKTSQEKDFGMCDYSLHSVSSRPARISDKLVTTKLARSHARAFAAVGEHGAKLVIHDSPPEVAVCLLPGTELAFDDNVRYDRSISLFGKGRVNHKVARFRQIDLDDPYAQHDALEFPDGQVLKVAQLVAGQNATVLQLPVAPQHSESVETRHMARSPGSRLALNRALRPGTASILVPNQATVMLWEALRSTTIGLSMALAGAFRGSKAHEQSPAGVDADRIEASFTVTPPKEPTAQRPEKKIDIKAAA
jgi:hypothetical protein